MEDNNREKIINGANPSIIWTQFYDALGLFSKQMKAEYTKRMRANNPITWDDLDVINKKIHDKLDYIMTWSDEFKNESIYKKNLVRLSESQLYNIIAESVKKFLKEVRVQCTDGQIRNLHGNNARDWTQMSKLRKQRANQYSKYSPEWERNMDARERNSDIASDMELDDINNLNHSLKNY